MPQLSNIAFTVRIDLTGAPTIILTDTSNTSVVRQGYFTISLPGLNRSYVLATPDTTETDTSFSYVLPLATDGTVRLGKYTITFTLIASGYTNTSLAQTFTLAWKDIKPSLAPKVDFKHLLLQYQDKTDYTQAGYDAPFIVRAWSVDSKATGPFTSNDAVLDLINNGLYYDTIYNVVLVTTAEYQHSSISWLSVVDAYSGKATLDEKLYPTFSVLLGWVKEHKKGSGKCGCEGKGDACKAICQLSYIKFLACEGDSTDIGCEIETLYKLTHKNGTYKATHTHDAIIPGANDLCGCDCKDEVVCGPAATVLSFDNLTATSAQVHFTEITGQTYDLYLSLPNGTKVTILNVSDGDVIGSLLPNTVYVPKLTTRCTGTARSIVGAPFTTINALRIVTQPTDESENVGDTATFGVVAAGGVLPYTYQWFLGDPGSANPISGSTASTYTTGTLTLNDDGNQYTVNVTDSVGAMVTSDTVELTVATGVCTCPVGFDVSENGICEKFETEEADVSTDGYCIAPATPNGLYSSKGSRIYAYPFDNTFLTVPYGAIGNGVVANMQDAPFWKNEAQNTTDGPMIKDGIWLDSDCDGQPDPVVIGTTTTFPYTYNNTGLQRIVHVGIGGDNTFKLIVNGVTVADTVAAYGQVIADDALAVWHVIPVLINTGVNYFNAVAVSGGVVDAIAMVVYDNTASEIENANSEADLDLLFASRNLRDLTYTVATCAPGWNVDNTGGIYSCKRTVYVPCGGTQLTITTQPANGSVGVGGNRSFSVAASGGMPAYSYQWQRRINGQWIDIAGATSATYTLTNAQSSDNGAELRAIVMDNATQAQTERSATATLTVTGLALAYRIGFGKDNNDPWINNSTVPSNITWIAQGNIVSAGAPIVISKNTVDFNKLADNFIVLEKVVTITDRTMVANGGLGPYNIPAQEFTRKATAAGKDYIVSNQPWALSLNDDLTFTA